MKIKKRVGFKKKFSKIMRGGEVSFSPVHEFPCTVTEVDGNKITFIMDGEPTTVYDFPEDIVKSLSPGSEFNWKVGYLIQPWGQRIKKSFIDIKGLENKVGTETETETVELPGETTELESESIEKT